MVLLDEGVEDFSKILIRVLVSSIDAAVLVVKLDCTSDSLGKGEPRCCSLCPRKLLPEFGGDILGDQGVGGVSLEEVIIWVIAPEFKKY